MPTARTVVRTASAELTASAKVDSVLAALAAIHAKMAASAKPDALRLAVPTANVANNEH